MCVAQSSPSTERTLPCMTDIALGNHGRGGRTPVVSVLLAALLAVAGARPLAAADTVVGFIYVGPKDDYGYNQAHHEGAEVVKAVAGVKVIEEEKVAETLDVQKTMESMIEL